MRLVRLSFPPLDRWAASAATALLLAAYASNVSAGGNTPLISVSDQRLFEGIAGTTSVGFSVKVSPSACGPVMVHYATENGTATTANLDYVGTSGDLTLLPQPPSFLSLLGTAGPGSADGQFQDPAGIAFGPAGDIYVVDQSNHRVQKFDANGNFLTKWGAFGSGNGQFNNPIGIGIDPSGNVYVADYSNERVQKFNSSGTFLAKWGTLGTADGQFMSPFGVAVDAGGFVYVTEFAGNRVQKFTSTGGFVTKWGSTGTGDGQFQAPGGIAIDFAGFVYVFDYANNRVQKFDGAGVFQTQWGTPGSGDGQFQFSEALAVDGVGCVYVNDLLGHRVQKFDSSGGFTTKWGTSGSGPGQFNRPGRGIAVNARGEIYVSDQLNHRVQKFSPVASSATITVVVNGDVRFEPNEEFRVVLSSPMNADLGKDVGIGLIGNDDQVELQIGNATVTETDAGTPILNFLVGLSGQNPSTVSATVQTADGTATLADADYVGVGPVAVQFTPSAPNFDLKWGSLGPATGQFNAPTHVALDGNGNVYVADFGNNRIQKFDSSGNFITAWGSLGTGDGQFQNPAGVAVDGFGNVYVADTNNDRMQKFDSNGTFIMKWGSFGFAPTPGVFWGLSGVAVDPAGDVYVADRNNNRIQKFDSNGAFLLQWGIFGVADGQFRAPFAVEVDAGFNVYVADLTNNRIQKFTSSGAFVTKWGAAGAGNGQFNSPQDVDVDASGFVYVADTNNNRVQKFTPTGMFILKWGQLGTGNGDFQGPRGLAIAANENVYVSDVGNHRIEKFRPSVLGSVTPVTVNGDTRIEPDEIVKLQLSGVSNATLTRSAGYGTIVNDDIETSIGDGRVVEGNTSTSGLDFLVSVRGAGCQPVMVHYETLDGSATLTDTDYLTASDDLTLDPVEIPAFERTWGSFGSGAGQLFTPSAVAVDGNGNVYVADRHNHRIQKFDPSGAFITQWGGLGTGDGRFNEPFGVAAGSGHVFVADGNNHRVQKFTESGTFLAKWGTFGSGPGQFNAAYALAVDASGNVYVADRDNDRIQKFDVNGNFLLLWGGNGTGPGQFMDPTGVAVDASGQVYVADFGNPRIQKFTSEGVVVTQWGSGGAGNGQFSGAHGVGVDGCGHVYVADRGNHRIQKFDVSGGFLAKWGTNGSANGQFNIPDGVAIDVAGNVYVDDEGNHRIQKFRPVDPLATVTVDVNGDTRLEGNQSIQVQLSVPSLGDLARDLATGLIVDDDAELRIADDRAIEGDASTTNLGFALSVRGAACGPISTHYQTADGSATLVDEDYETASGDVTLEERPPAFVLGWGTQGSNPGQFESPSGLATDGDGNVYVGDSYNHRIVKFDANGTPLDEWGTPGSAAGEFNFPGGVAVDAFGVVYVADEGNHRIQKFDAGGNFLGAWGSPGSAPGQFDAPGWVAVSRTGYVYVSELLNNRIQKFDADGNFISRWGTPGNGIGQFQSPSGLAVDDLGNVYVADNNNHRIQKFGPDGNYLTQWGSEGAGESQFSFPRAVAVDACGFVYVTDQSNDRIQKFDSNGTFVTTWGSVGTADGQFQSPAGIAVHDDGEIYVSEFSGHRIQRFTPSTPVGLVTVAVNGDTKYELNQVFTVVLSSVVNATPAKGTAYGLIVNDDPVEVSIADASRLEGNAVSAPLDFTVSLSGPICDSAFVHVETEDGAGAGGATVADIDYTSTSGDLAWGPPPPAFALKWGGPGSGNSQFDFATAVAIDGSGHVYTADYGNNRVQKFDADGTFITKWGTPGAGDGQFSRPYGMTVDGNDYVYVADYGNHRIQKFDANGNFVEKWGTNGTGDGQFQSPIGVAVSESGFVYVVEETGNRIQKFDTHGNFITKWGSSGSGPGQFALPSGIAVGDDYVYVVDHLNSRVQKFASDGTFLTLWGNYGTGDGEFNSAFGVGVDADGSVYVGDRGNYRIQKFDANGGFVTKWGTPGTGDGDFSVPHTPAVNAQGDVYVTDTYLHRVKKFTAVTPVPVIVPVTINGDKKVELDETFAVKLSAPSGAALGDDAATGTIQNDDAAPAVTVVAPNGGESWAPGSHHDIEWTATDDGTITSVDLAYSIDGGLNYIPIATGIPNASPYDWTVPNTLTNTARVRVTAHDDGLNDGGDASDANFAIAEPNLVGNPGFENGNVSGWVKVGNAALSLAPGAGRTGNAMQVKGTSGDSDIGADDSPNWITLVAAKGAVYRFSAYVKSLTHTGDVFLDIREFLGSTQQGTTFKSAKVRLSTTWMLVTVDYTVRKAGTKLSLRIMDDQRSSKETFLVDDVSILLLSVPADQPPVVVSPAVVNGSVGNLVSFTVTASDPDAQTITTFAAAPLPPGANFTTNLAKTLLTFSWTPTVSDIGSHDVFFTASNALSGQDTTRINVTAAPPELCTNGGFDTNISGWTKYGSATLSHAPGVGRSGGALKIFSSSSSSYGCDDLPNWVGTVAGKGAVYRFSAWVKTATGAEGEAKIRLYEFLGSSQQGSTAYSNVVPLSSTWQFLTLNYTVRTNGTTLSMRVTNEPNVEDETFLVDDVSIVQVSGPTVAAVALDAVELEVDAAEPGTPARPVRATTDLEALRLDGPTGPWGARLESIPHALEADIPAVFLEFGGREVAALGERTSLGEDRDQNGFEEMAVWFDPAALAELFATLPPGTHRVDAILEARSGELTSEAPLSLEVEGRRLVYGAVFAPNPAPGAGALSFTLTRPGWARVDVFDTGGRRVRTLVNGTEIEAGTHRIAIGGQGRASLPSGLYFYRVESAEGVLGGRFVLMK